MSGYLLLLAFVVLVVVTLGGGVLVLAEFVTRMLEVLT